MPFAMKQNGILLGSLLILLSGSAAASGLYLQGLCSSFLPRGKASFFAVAQITYPSLSVVFDLAIAVKCFGVGVSYLIIIEDLMPQISDFFGYSGVFQSRLFWLTIAMAISGPLSFLRKLDSLKYTSLVALLSVGYLIVLVAVRFFIEPLPPTSDINFVYPQSFSSVLSVLPVLIFGFTCHQNMFSAVNELGGKRTESVFVTIVASSIYPAAAMYLLVGIVGYLTFGSSVGGNVIAMYPYSLSTIVGRLAIVVLVLFSYPLQAHPCRASVANVVHWVISRVRSDNGSYYFATLEREEPELEVVSQYSVRSVHVSHLSLGMHLGVTLVIIIFSFITASKVTSLEVMLAFVGSTGSTAISFILPGLFGYALLKKLVLTGSAPDFNRKFYGSDEPSERSSYLSKSRVIKNLAFVLFVLGVCLMVLCLGINLWLRW